MDNEKIDPQPNGQPALQPQKPAVINTSNLNVPRSTPPTRIIDPHAHFCALLGIDHPSNKHSPSINTPNPTTIGHDGPILSAAATSPKLEPLYPRLQKRYASQRHEYTFTAALSNSLLLLQILIGAVVTALSAVNTDHVVVTVFGAANTVIAGMIAYFKSRGQPMRSRAFRDELEVVVDAVEDAEARIWGLMKEQGWVSAHSNTQGQHNPLSPEAMKAGGGAIPIHLAGSIRDGQIHGVAEPEGVTEGQMTPEEWRALIRDEIDRLATMYDEACDTARRNYPDLYVKGSEMAVGRGKRRGDPPAHTATSSAVKLANGKTPKPSLIGGGAGGGGKKDTGVGGGGGAAEGVKEEVQNREAERAGGTHG